MTVENSSRLTLMLLAKTNICGNLCFFDYER